jgi:hypothetical protein
MTTATEPGRNGSAHDRNGHAPASRPAGTLPPLPPVSDGSATPQPAAEGRADGGRFAPGNRFGKGNPFTRRLAAKRAAFADAVTDAEVAALARQLYRQALDGDLQAAALLLSYTIGKPANAVDPDAMDLQEWKAREEWDSVSAKCFRNISYADALRIARALRELGSDGAE